MQRVIRAKPQFRQFVVAAAMLASSAAAPAGAAPPTWSVRFNAGSQDAPAEPPSFPQGGSQFDGILGSRNVAVDSQGDVYVAGTITLDPADGEDFLIEKYSAAGALLWSRSLDGGSHFRDTATCLALAANAVYVTGESCKTNASTCNSDFLTVKIDAASGAQLWAKLADGPDQHQDTVPCVAVDALGTPFVAGTTRNTGNTNISDFLTIKYNPATGAEAWRSLATTPSSATSQSQDVVGTLAVGGDGHVVVSGSGDQTLGGFASLLTVKMDTGNGAQLWAHNATSIQNVYPYAIVLDAASNPIVVGETDKFGDPKFLTLKYQGGNGALSWMRNDNYATAGGDDGAHDVALDPSGNVYVTGRRRVGGGYTVRTVKYEATSGTELWAHDFGSGAAGDDYLPTAIAFSGSNGRVIVAGYRRSADGSRDIFVESLNAVNGFAGALQTTSDVLAYDLAVDTAVDAGGNAIVAGGAASVTRRDLVVLKYDAALTELWRVADGDLETQDILGPPAMPQFGRRKIAVDALGSTVVVGSTAPTVYSPAIDFLVQKYGPAGNLLWSRTLGNAVGIDFGAAVALGGTSAVYVTGWSTNPTGLGYDILTLRLDAATGATVWQQRYNGPANNNDLPYAIALGTDRVFVAGVSHDGTKSNLLVLGYPLADGNAPWLASLDFPGGSVAYAATVGCRDRFFSQCIEGVYVTGVAINATSPSSGNQFLTALFDADSGTLVTGLTQSGGDAVGLAIAAFGNPSTVVATGRANGNWITTAFAGSSALPLWTQVRDFDALEDQALDVAFDSAGDAFVSGFATQTPDLNRQAATVKYDSPSGTELASTRFGVPEVDATAFGVGTDFAGGVYIGGSRRDRVSGESDLLFLSYTNDLVLRTGGVLDSLGSDDRGSALAVEKSSGDAVVAGTSFAAGTAGDLLLAKYRAPERGTFYTMTPCRLYDSRTESAGPLMGGETRMVSALGFVGGCTLLTPAVKNLAINITVVGATGAGYLQLYPSNISVPGTSAINFGSGQVRANNMVLGLATDAAGAFAIRSGMPAGQAVHVIVDLAGYFD